MLNEEIKHSGKCPESQHLMGRGRKFSVILNLTFSTGLHREFQAKSSTVKNISLSLSPSHMRMHTHTSKSTGIESKEVMPRLGDIKV